MCGENCSQHKFAEISFGLLKDKLIRDQIVVKLKRGVVRTATDGLRITLAKAMHKVKQSKTITETTDNTEQQCSGRRLKNKYGCRSGN